MLIDVTAWSDFSCEAAAGWTVFYALLATAFLWFFLNAARRAVTTEVTGWRDRNMKLATRGFSLLPALPLAVVLLLFAFQHTRQKIFTEGANLVETGCYRLSDYRYAIPLERLRGRYEFFFNKGRHDNVIFSVGRNYRELSVDLKGSPYLENIRKLAPVAVDEYLRELKKGD